jgi:undecaprenyl diphosphate synthase
MNPINHVAIIMDGNGRWGLKNKNSKKFGYKEGVKRIEEILNLCRDLKIKYLTLYVFSTENWKRPKQEIKYLFELLQSFLSKKVRFLSKNNFKIIFMGKKKFNKALNHNLINLEKSTKKNKGLQINLALNYGSKTEIIDSVKKIVKKKLTINEENLSNNLYTKEIPDPEILIRTGDTNRLSNFLLWQLSYTEIFFVKKLWPDFKRKDFLKIIKKFKKIKRNFGSV